MKSSILLNCNKNFKNPTFYIRAFDPKAVLSPKKFFRRKLRVKMFAKIYKRNYSIN